MKKSIFILVMFVMVAAGAFAQNFNVSDFRTLGYAEMSDFLEAGADVDLIREISTEGLPSSIRVDRFFRIEQSREDNEDRRLVNWVIQNRLPATSREGTQYFVTVERNVTDSSADGWILYFRRNNTGDWNYFLYYFSMVVR